MIRFHRLIAVGLVLLLSGCQRTAQVAADPLVIKELDALYTAVTARSPELLQASRSRLQKLYDTKHLERPAYQRLSRDIQQAEQGEWKAAAESLYRFMRAQRKPPN